MTQGRRQNVSWSGAQGAPGPVANNAGFLINVFTLAIPGDFVIERTHMVYSVQINDLISDGVIRGAVGFAVVSTEAAAEAVGGNLAAIPDPFTEIDSDLWYAYFPFAFTYNQSATAHANSNPFWFDSKAKRKIGDGQAIVQVYRSQNTTADTTDIPFVTRFLVKQV